MQLRGADMFAAVKETFSRLKTHKMNGYVPGGSLTRSPIQQISTQQRKVVTLTL